MPGVVSPVSRWTSIARSTSLTIPSQTDHDRATMTANVQQGELRIDSESDIVAARKAIRDAATGLSFGITDVTRIVTAASELARNAFLYAGSGVMRWRALDEKGQVGIELIFEDQGPGIPDVVQAMQQGYSSKGGLGLGLPGAKRLMDELEIESTVGQGTTILTRKWQRR
jgi:serine/threonine-protein kinase RsbT